MDDLRLLQIQVETLFTQDADGRMLCQNEPGADQPVAPRVFLGRTRAGSVWRCRHDVPKDSARQVDDLLAREPAATDLRLPPACLDSLAAILEAQAPVEAMESGPAYRFPEEMPLTADVVEITSANVYLLEEVTGDREMEQPCAAVVRDGRAVSVCQSVRLSAQAHEAGVDTLEAYRGRGYASAAVVGWALLVRQAGCLPLYSTSWVNLASQGVARRLGLILYGVDLDLT